MPVIRLKKIKLKAAILPAVLLVTFLLAACGDNTATTEPVPAVALTVIPDGSPVPSTAPGSRATTTASGTPAAGTTPSKSIGGEVQPAKTTTPTPEGYPGKIVYSLIGSASALEAGGDIFVINPDGSGKTKVGQGSTPLFSPDGKKVAFLAPTGQKVSAPFGDVAEFGIMTVNLDGSGKETLYTDTPNAAMFLVRWSPRGRFIAMDITQNGPGTLNLISVPDKKFNSQIKTKQGNASLVYDWTPDGDYAIWQASTDYTAMELYYGDPDKAGEGATAVTKSQNRIEDGSWKYYSSARVSPDGKTIAIAGSKIFFLSVPGQKSPLEGKTLENLGPKSTLAWSPDGKALAVIDGGDKALKLVDIASGNVTKIADNAVAVDWTR